MYFSWLFVLLGAELCATMPEWHNGQRIPATIEMARALRQSHEGSLQPHSPSYVYLLEVNIGQGKRSDD
tara:strand:+ start:1323 stop:1529 length:207 start_codon:yes stop_codon:yes gene_type:complete